MNDPFYFGQLLYLHSEILSKLFLPIQNSHGMFTFGPANKDRHKTKSLVSWLWFNDIRIFTALVTKEILLHIIHQVPIGIYVLFGKILAWQYRGFKQLRGSYHLSNCTHKAVCGATLLTE